LIVRSGHFDWTATPRGAMIAGSGVKKMESVTRVGTVARGERPRLHLKTASFALPPAPAPPPSWRRWDRARRCRAGIMRVSMVSGMRWALDARKP
jgi:hypothetical protein